MSPLFIKIMLHFYSSPFPYVHPETPIRYPEAVTDIIETARADGLLNTNEHLLARIEERPFTLTPRGKAYVDRLMSTPLPRKVETWVFDDPEATE